MWIEREETTGRRSYCKENWGETGNGQRILKKSGGVDIFCMYASDNRWGRPMDRPSGETSGVPTIHVLKGVGVTAMNEEGVDARGVRDLE